MASATHLNIREKWLKQTGAGNGETLRTETKGDAVGVIYYNPVASRTGVILQAGDENGQMVKVVNIAAGAYSITFAADATSKILGGTSVVIGQNQSLNLVYSKDLGYWVPLGVTLTTAITATQIASNAVTTSKIFNGNVTGAKLSTGAGYFVVTTATNGTTAVNVFGAGGAPVALTVTSVISIAKDTTAGNIIVKQAANTVATIAKGTTSGALVGAASLANATYAAADVCTVESSSAGNSFVVITFTVA